MPSLKLEVRSATVGSPDLVAFFIKGSPLPAGVPASEFDGAPCSTVLLRDKNQRTLFVGLGEKEKIEPDTIRRAAGAGIKQLLKLGSGDIALDLDGFADHVGPAVEGAILASYKFDGFGKDASKKTRGVLSRLQIIVKENEVYQARAQAREAEIVASISNTVRAIGNLPGNMLTPAILAEKAQELAKGRALTVKVWNERHLARDGFGGILAVGQGSVNPPRLIVLEYRGGAKRDTPIALVGKAITFDTGGISIKPGAAMDEMKFDKMGGLAVLGMMLAAADLKLPLNLIGLIPSAENMPGPDAYRPGDIITTRDGKTIEVLNTDAEGRIILADAVAHARLTYKPSAILEYSTLTGAVIMALGHRRAGMFTSAEKLRDAFMAAGKSTGELVWPMPIDDEFRENVLSEIATAKNTSFREGSACSSASFVKLWAEETPSSTSTSPAPPGPPSRPRTSKAARPASASASPSPPSAPACRYDEYRFHKSSSSSKCRTGKDLRGPFRALENSFASRNPSWTMLVDPLFPQSSACVLQCSPKSCVCRTGNAWVVDRFSRLKRKSRRKPDYKLLSRGLAEIFLKYRSPYWQAIRKIARALRIDDPLHSFLFTNVFPCDVDKRQAPLALHSDFRSWKILPQELRILAPDYVIFFCRGEYFGNLESFFGAYPVEYVSKQTPLVRYKPDGVSWQGLVTYHPAYLRRSGKWSTVLHNIVQCIGSSPYREPVTLEELECRANEVESGNIKPVSSEEFDAHIARLRESTEESR